jgi:hypothetical protein
MTRTLLAAAGLAALALPATADARPAICTKKGLVEVLAAKGKDPMAGVAQIRCGDVTGDGRKDSVFTLLSGGTAGPTRFGVIRGGGDLVLFKQGYKVTVDRVSSTRFDAQQPIYKSGDPNCCPSAFRFTPYRWTGSAFKAGESKRYRKPKQRFF